MAPYEVAEEDDPPETREQWVGPDVYMNPRSAAQADPEPQPEKPPIPMILHCPVCHRQHVDEVDPVGNPGWENPPHTSHKCLGCGCVWRPAEVPTCGVAALPRHGKSDTWPHIGRRQK